MSTNNIKGQEVGKEEENLKQTKAEKDELSVSTNKKSQQVDNAEVAKITNVEVKDTPAKDSNEVGDHTEDKIPQATKGTEKEEKRPPKNKEEKSQPSDNKTTKSTETQKPTEVIKPKAKALVLAPISKEEPSKPLVTKPATTKSKPASSTQAKSVNQKNTKTKKTSPKEGEATNTTEDQKLKLPFFRRIHIKIGYVIAGIVVLVLTAFFGRVALWEHDYLNRMEGSERHTTATENPGVGDDGEEVDTTEPTEAEIQEYIVAADKPRYFSIPSLGIYNARIMELGVKENGELATPWNIYDMGWYTGSSLPGQVGVSMFDGHGGDIGYGILKTLPRIAIGAIIKIEMGDGRVFNYRVVDTAVKAIGDEANAYMATAFSTPDGSRSSLSIITCTGDYWQYSQTYSHRFFLRAVLEN